MVYTVHVGKKYCDLFIRLQIKKKKIDTQHNNAIYFMNGKNIYATWVRFNDVQLNIIENTKSEN